LVTDGMLPLTKTYIFKKDTEEEEKKITPDGSCKLPQDYLHILNCICYFSLNEGKGNCQNKHFSTLEIPAKKMNSDSLSLIYRNYYNKPSYK